MKRSYTRSVIALLILCCLTVQGQIPQPDPATIGAALFIGQAYPSGNVYLKSLSGSQQRTENWPRSVLLVQLFSEPPRSRITALEATLVSRTVKSEYIPGLEGMDDQHLSCGAAEPRKKVAAFRYESVDFFEAISDYCGGNEGVALYQSPVLSHSVRVLAFTAETTLTGISLQGGRRPLTSVEKQEVARQKLEMERAGGCTTTPVFLDSAVRVAEASVGDGLTVRLSSYKTPGCAGHLATIYVLDLLQRNDLIRTFQVSQNHGPL